MDKQIKNVVDVISNTASKALLEKLDNLEKGKDNIELELQRMEFDNSIQDVSEEEIEEWFETAKVLLKSGKLSSSKELIDLFVDRVTVYEEHIELIKKVKPDLSLPAKDENKSSFSQLRETTACPLDGAEGTAYNGDTQSIDLINFLTFTGKMDFLFQHADRVAFYN